MKGCTSGTSVTMLFFTTSSPVFSNSESFCFTDMLTFPSSWRVSGLPPAQRERREKKLSPATARFDCLLSTFTPLDLVVACRSCLCYEESTVDKPRSGCCFLVHDVHCTGGSSRCRKSRKGRFSSRD